MAWKETFSTSSTSLKVSMALAPLQAIVYIIGYSTNYWVTEKVTSVNTGSLLNKLGFKVSNGLWGSKLCLLDQCQTIELGSIPDWLHVTRLFATLALIGFVVTTVGVFVCLFVTQLSQRRILHILTCVVATSTAVCVLVAVIIYGTQYNNLDQRFLTQTGKDPSWSYGLCVAALILDIITSILLAINALRKPII
ncbi:uncharacterized protein [Magallana gigas]|uniref:uncharacterized protein n=1 Tax=Magallana gigas TaxID=29159 RepID=UPI003340A037